jgi:hypothetical protein
MKTAEAPAAKHNPDTTTGHWLNRNVWTMSLASLFSDAGHEGATVVLPILLASIGGAAALDLIEGVADLASSVLVGLLWSRVSAAVAFTCAAVFAKAGAVFLVLNLAVRRVA